MSTPLCDCAIAIDTNVFEHLFNPEQNRCDHINAILQDLIESGAKLLVDSKSRIPNEYHNRLDPRLDSPEHLNEINLLRYWLNREVWKTVPGDRPPLMTAIRDVMRGPDRSTDRVFVYVAFHQGENLLSNDLTHVVEGHPKRQHSQVRDELRNKTKRVHPPSKSSHILTSQEAFEQIKPVP